VRGVLTDLLVGLGVREGMVVLQGGGEGVGPTPMQVVCSCLGRPSQSGNVTRPSPTLQQNLAVLTTL